MKGAMLTKDYVRYCMLKAMAKDLLNAGLLSYAEYHELLLKINRDYGYESNVDLYADKP